MFWLPSCGEFQKKDKNRAKSLLTTIYGNVTTTATSIIIIIITSKIITIYIILLKVLIIVPTTINLLTIVGDNVSSIAVGTFTVSLIK